MPLRVFVAWKICIIIFVPPTLKARLYDLEQSDASMSSRIPCETQRSSVMIGSKHLCLVGVVGVHVFMVSMVVVVSPMIEFQWPCNWKPMLCSRPLRARPTYSSLTNVFEDPLVSKTSVPFSTLVVWKCMLINGGGACQKSVIWSKLGPMGVTTHYSLTTCPTMTIISHSVVKIVARLLQNNRRRFTTTFSFGGPLQPKRIAMVRGKRTPWPLLAPLDQVRLVTIGIE